MPIQYYIFLSLALFSIGVMGTMMRRNAIIIFMCIELMLNAVNLLMVAFSNYWENSNAQIFVFFIMTVAAAEVAVGLAIIVMIYIYFLDCYPSLSGPPFRYVHGELCLCVSFVAGTMSRRHIRLEVAAIQADLVIRSLAIARC